jgi:glycosyltransferase involved in cell wall biosynthesis
VNAVGWLVALLAAAPASMFLANLPAFRRLRSADGPMPPVSVLIPARNEEHFIGDAVRAALANTDLELEVLVLDDASTDGTAAVVSAIAAGNARVRLISGESLPEGWTGKQYACFVLARNARHKWLCFVDADVRLASDALGRMLASMDTSGAALLSGFPRQIAVTFLERLLLPLIHFGLLGVLPIRGVKGSTNPVFAAGCGQLILVRRQEYFRTGGHAAIRETLHDGIRLPPAFRERGFRTDIFDATDVAEVRKYANAGEVWFGLARNAVEGLATPRWLPVCTVLLFGGQVLPFVLLLSGAGWPLSLVAAVLAILPRLIASIRFRQPIDSVVLHPLGILVLVVLQWWALIRYLRRRPVSWKGREYVQTP